MASHESSLSIDREVQYFFIASCEEYLEITLRRHEPLSKFANNHQQDETMKRIERRFVVFDWLESFKEMKKQTSPSELLSCEGLYEYLMNKITSDTKKESDDFSALDSRKMTINIVIRTTWNYVDYYDEFMEWLRTLEQLQKECQGLDHRVMIRVFNDPSLMIWNSSKRYLFEIQDEWNECEIVPSQIVDFDTVKHLNDDELVRKYCFMFKSCDKLVFKPLISAGSFNTFVIGNSRESTDEGSCQSIEYLTNRAEKLKIIRQDLSESNQCKYKDRKLYIVQPFLDCIVNDGEYSFIYVNEKLSHMLQKRPKDGDFRVQGEFGGSNTYADLSRFNETIIANGQRLFEKIKKEKSPNHLILYCRLDVVIDWQTNNIRICELELLEPHLYFETIDPNDPAVAIDKENELYDAIVNQNTTFNH
ncbi:hypothetical protein C9374_003880 [Naegleria lovaniensis]|uniref:Uncharacterized protein n=1 Tax=Naegleria lovaniensis TaxID=51637 RepID=A0AA88KSG1_NAELO|nr:uncharacterized protein C9374_003880 [Naegleria lovaniensis]KAG2394116.1 hypothetical protein C9374_003880 [Naegleria lovaniensis]